MAIVVIVMICYDIPIFSPNYAAVALFCHAALQESSANANGGLARRRNRRSTCGTLLHATGQFDYYRYY
jgi:hypothetical protein